MRCEWTDGSKWWGQGSHSGFLGHLDLGDRSRFVLVPALGTTGHVESELCAEKAAQPATATHGASLSTVHDPVLVERHRHLTRARAARAGRRAGAA